MAAPIASRRLWSLVRLRLVCDGAKHAPALGGSATRRTSNALRSMASSWATCDMAKLVEFPIFVDDRLSWAGIRGRKSG